MAGKLIRRLMAIRTLSRNSLIVVCVSAFVCFSGCNRGYYRRQADNEAQRLILQKSSDPRWNQSSDGTIEIDPQSRMFDPFSADHPPIPPDDPSSHQLMRCVDGRRGYPYWHANGDTDFVENPEWRSYLPVNEDGEVLLDLDAAYRMALLNSPDLQSQREVLYLSALDVSLERFGFDTQLFAGYNSFLTQRGSDRGEGTFLSSDFGQNSEGFTLTRLGITGTTFVAGLANSILWNFSGPNTQSATSLIDFSIIQPLLQNAGRDRILEALTLAERRLLADVRQLDRFRRGFYLNVATGRNPGAGPGTNYLNPPVGASRGVGGYIGLLRQQQQIRIQEFNVRQLENVLEQFRELFRRERIDSLQVRQFEQSLYAQQNILLTQKTAYQTSLDNFKRTLGIPPGIEVRIEDDLLKRFEFIGDEISDRLIEINILRNETGEALNLIDEFAPQSIELAADPDFVWPVELEQSIRDLGVYIQQSERLIAKLSGPDREQIEADLEKLGQIRSNRVSYLEKLRSSIDSGEIVADIEPAILQPESILTSEALQEQLNLAITNLQQTKAGIDAIRGQIENFEEVFANSTNEEIYLIVREKIGTETSERLSQLYSVALEMSLVQAQARGNSLELAEIDLNDKLAFGIARCFRRDLMNARAALVDQWRQIEFFADELESELSLVLEGEIGNNGNSPFSFRTANGQLRGGFRFDAPIVRLSERNRYRTALINYQQARRSYYQFEDEVHANLRQTLRELDLNKILFELNKQNLRVAIEQIELAQLRLEDPNPLSLGSTTARDLTQAISDLQRSQTQLLDVWVIFEITRRDLDFDLGTFQLGPDSSWIDPGVIDASIGARAAAMMGINLEDECYCDFHAYADYFDSANNVILEPTLPIEIESGVPFQDENIVELPPPDVEPTPGRSSEDYFREN